jgi:threonylcarbamoyladenosine tRNA methylthiotransferase MtaB
VIGGSPTGNSFLLYSMKKAAFHTLGCKLNFAETASFMRRFRERGFAVSDTVRERADVCVVNTCSVTEKADRECRQIVRRALRHSPDAYIIVVGCYAQLAPEEIASIEGVDLVLGSSEKFSIFAHADPEFRKERVPRICTSPIDEATGFGPAYSFESDGRTRAFLKIQDGCDYTCTFCTIPLARGASRSQSVAETVAQAESLVADGFKEIVLTGVNVGDYGRKEGGNLLDLVRRLTGVTGLRRLRISSIEPNLLTDELLEFWVTSDVLVPHFHIPLQSGSDAILRKMSRRYQTDHYRTLIRKIRQRLPLAGIGVDVIVGFPGETDDHFTESYTFLNELPVTYLHAFSYSERENTPAAAFTGRIDPGKRTKRTTMLRILSEKKMRAFMEQFVAREVKVLFEESIENGYIKGLTPEYIRVAARYRPELVNTESSVMITSLNGNIAYGEPVSKNEETEERKRTVYLPVIQG